MTSSYFKNGKSHSNSFGEETLDVEKEEDFIYEVSTVEQGKDGNYDGFFVKKIDNNNFCFFLFYNNKQSSLFMKKIFYDKIQIDKT